MMNNIDPYDMLINLNERLHRMEQAHNNLAREYERTNRDLDTALKTIQTTQKHVLKLHQIIQSYNANKTDTGE